MRIDKFLKVSRIIKRRTVANEACDAGRVSINGKVCKASAYQKEVKRMSYSLTGKLVIGVSSRTLFNMTYENDIAELWLNPYNYLMMAQNTKNGLLEYVDNPYLISNNDKNGIESGIFRMYNVPNEEPKVPVDSLWNSWLLEAAAELGMSEYLNIKPGTYAKKISYARSYNLSRFNELDLKNNSIEDVVFNHTLEEAYHDLRLNSPEEQREFLNFLYSVEITQTDPEDFWANYTAQTGTNPTEEEKLGIRMDIRTDAVKFLTRNFYDNLADAIYTGDVKDLDSAFYLIRTWELDVFGHLEYTKTSSLEHSKDFIEWHNEVQNKLFNAIASSSNLTLQDVQSQYEEYNLQASVDETIHNNCTFSNYNDYTAAYITEAKNYYSTSKFSRNSIVYDYIKASTKSTEAEQTITK